jgi:hypothetical protein
VAVGSGKRSFTGSGAIFGDTGGRIAFGIGAILIWIFLAAILFSFATTRISKFNSGSLAMLAGLCWRTPAGRFLDDRGSRHTPGLVFGTAQSAASSRQLFSRRSNKIRQRHPFAAMRRGSRTKAASSTGPLLRLGMGHYNFVASFIHWRRPAAWRCWPRSAALFIAPAACSAGSSRRRTSPAAVRARIGRLAPSRLRPRPNACRRQGGR